MKFAHLHCRSYHSMMRGTASLERLVAAAREAGMDSLALTDLGGLYGWVDFVKLCGEHGIRALCGVELPSADGAAWPWQNSTRSSVSAMVVLTISPSDRRQSSFPAGRAPSSPIRKSPPPRPKG